MTAQWSGTGDRPDPDRGVDMTGNGVGPATTTVDVVVVGAGMAGLYLLHELRDRGVSAVVVETGDDVGGTWYWNRYPGARCDIQSLDYSYTWDPDLDHEWQWSEKYAAQPEILRYLQFVADKHDLRRDIRFATRIASARWDASSDRWQLTTDAGDVLVCRHYVMATGCLSVPKEIDIPGAEAFAGPTYLTGRWPHEGVDFTGKRVAVIGTGSSAIQSIPIIAAQAAQLTVFQRTPNFSIPANNGPIPESKRSVIAADPAAYRDSARHSSSGVPYEMGTVSALAVSEAERLATYEMAWERGGIIEFLGTYSDHLFNPDANELLAEFVRNKIRSIVHDPVTAEALCPHAYPIGTKRLCVDSNYYATYNLPHVRLVDLRAHPIVAVTATGVELVDESVEVDVIVFATGFDAMTGAIVAVDIEGRDGRTLKQAWEHGPTTYLGLMAAGFPNLFFITGPGSPSVLSNMVVSIEQHVDWVVATIEHLRAEGLSSIEPTPSAVEGWVQHTNDFADITLMPRANSWYMGANVPGKARVFLPYPGGCDRYRAVCDEVVAKGYLGFELRGPGRAECHDGVIRRVQPDAQIMLEMMAQMGLPPLESLSPVEVRAFTQAMEAQRAPGPAVAAEVDGTLPAADGSPLAWRLYRPAGDGPHPLIVYFHGGGWVFGSATSDEPFCRDLCVRTGAAVLSVDYRHAPETRFPGAADDATGALRWAAAHAAELGCDPSRLIVAGWSAGGNVAAVAAQRARDGGPALLGQVLVTPVTDGTTRHPSWDENADGYVLTAGLMSWFWDHYADPADRADPAASPLRAADLSGLPPAVVVTAELDPLRDEGRAYAAAMAAAGVRVREIRARGHLHSSLTAVDMLLSGAPVRAEIAEAIGELLTVGAVAAAG
jgi:cation diffusion facilitator CzcD-associated flavoprotein CzcO/acetyl esterase/lipase